MWTFLVLAVLTAQAAPAAPSDGGAAHLMGRALVEGGAYHFARELSDNVGARVTGSPQAEQAVIWAEAAMKRAGLQAVRREPVEVKRWVRGTSSASLLASRHISGAQDQPLAALALGGSVATPAGGLEANVVEATSFASLTALGARVQGAMVFFNREMQATPEGSGYGEVSALRVRGPAEAARLGAVAVLVRSAGTGHHGLPHTGALHYLDGVTPIPAAALSAEDADLIHRRLLADGTARVRLQLAATQASPTRSFNVVGEVPGGTQREEIVLIGAHLDSWDVGRGAIDDASGCGIVLDTARLLTGLRLPRTVRVVLFMSEEEDGAGALAYAAAHHGEMGRHVAALEADSGAGRPLGFGVGGEAGVALVARWVAPLGLLIPTPPRAIEHGGADTKPLQLAGVPVMEVLQDASLYFDWHHSPGDTVDKIVPLDLALTTGAFATLTAAAASDRDRLPRALPPAAP